MNFIDRWPSALAYADEHMAEYPPKGLAQPNLDTHHLAAKVASLVNSKIRCAATLGLEGPSFCSHFVKCKAMRQSISLDMHHLAAKVASLGTCPAQLAGPVKAEQQCDKLWHCGMIQYWQILPICSML